MTAGDAYDAIVVGAGPAGSSAAYALARYRARVLLLDKAAFPREKVCGDGLTPRAVAALDEMGVLERVRPAGQQVAGIEVIAPDGTGVTAAVPAPAMLVVPRLHLDEAIRVRAVEAGASFEAGVEVEDIERRDGRVVVRGRGEGAPIMYRARLAIIATGAAMTLPRRLAGLPRRPAMMLAARTYVARRSTGGGIVGGRTPRAEIRFAGVPLPGYGWVFPTSAVTANAGVGFFALRRRRDAPRARPACERFLETLREAGAAADAAPARAIRSYPLRIDFPASPVRADGVLFAGEAAGLVNPLTGEGIDYALESGRLAAEHAASFLAGTDHSPRAFDAAAAVYERELRRRFGRLFAFGRALRGLAAQPAVLNRFVRVAARRDDLRAAFINMVLGNREPIGAAAIRSVLAQALAVR